MKIFFLFLISSLSLAAELDPLNGSLELNTSVSHAYDARSTFSNPSALGFQTELNDASLLSSFSYATNKYLTNEFSLGLSYGYFGFGIERLSPAVATAYQRYSFALGTPVTAGLYFGTRFSTTGADTTSLSGVHSLDFGLQYRPSRLFSLGLEMNRTNRPTIAGVQSPVQYIIGATLAPLPESARLLLSIDADTLSTNFAKEWGYQATASFQVLPGLYLDAGYHRERHWMFGLQFNVAHAKLFSGVQPNSDERRFTFGFQTGTYLRRSIVQPMTVLKILLDEELSEEGAPKTFLSKGRPSLIQLLSTLEDAARDPKLSLVLIKLEKFPLGLGATQDLTEALLKLRNAGKQIEVFLGNAGVREYLIASAATKIHMEASGELRFIGPKSERFYAKGTLDKIGIEAELIGRGEYKSAPETFTRKESSPANKEATLHELKTMESALVALLSKTRKNAANWKMLTTYALFSAEEALSQKLVDSIDRSNEEIEKLSSWHIVRETAEYQKERLNLPPQVAVIVADGDILQNKTRLLSLAGGSQVTPETLHRKFRYALKDSLTRAIVLRVSSPGGEILASQEIANTVAVAKTKKPVVISMGDVAASGGYMISAPATRIFANPLSVTGSVGVFLGKVNFEGLFKKLDLRKEILSTSPYAGILSESRPWTKQERVIMVRRLNQYYEGFVGYVSTERKISKEEAEKAAKGRVWLGEDAKRLKLVDELGGLREAVQYAAGAAGIDQDAFEVTLIRESYGPFGFSQEDLLFGREANLNELALSLVGSRTARDIAWLTRLSNSPFLYWAPKTYTD